MNYPAIIILSAWMGLKAIQYSRKTSDLKFLLRSLLIEGVLVIPWILFFSTAVERVLLSVSGVCPFSGSPVIFYGVLALLTFLVQPFLVGFRGFGEILFLHDGYSLYQLEPQTVTEWIAGPGFLTFVQNGKKHVILMFGRHKAELVQLFDRLFT